MGDGRVDSAALLDACRDARRSASSRFDMAAVAERTGSVISAVLFGALAGAGVLPFSRAQFEATIERGGVGVDRVEARLLGGLRCRERPRGPRRRCPAPRLRPAEAHGGRKMAPALARSQSDPAGRSRTARRGHVHRPRRRRAARRLPGRRLRPALSARLSPIAEADRKHGDGTGGSPPRPRATWRWAWPMRTRSASPN